MGSTKAAKGLAGPMTMPVRPDISASLATSFAYKLCFQIGKPDVIGPRICADRNRVAALVIRTIDQETAHAHVAHVGQGDLLRSVHLVFGFPKFAKKGFGKR